MYGAPDIKADITPSGRHHLHLTDTYSLQHKCELMLSSILVPTYTAALVDSYYVALVA